MGRVVGVCASSEVVPIGLGYFHAVVLGCLSDVREGKFSIVIANAFNLVETRQGVLNVFRVGQRFLALFRKSEDGFGQIIPLAACQIAMFGVRFPRRFHVDSLRGHGLQAGDPIGPGKTTALQSSLSGARGQGPGARGQVASGQGELFSGLRVARTLEARRSGCAFAR